MSTYLGYMLGGDLEVALLTIDHGPKTVATNVGIGRQATDKEEECNAMFVRHDPFQTKALKAFDE